MFQFKRTAVLLALPIVFSKTIIAQSNVCATPTPLTVNSSCSATLGTLFNATDEGTYSSTCATSAYDVWYSFTTSASSSAVNIDLTENGNGANNITSAKTFIEVFRGTSCAPILIGSCTPVGSTISVTGLATNTTYYIRVFTNTNPNTNETRWDFNICVTSVAAPGNNECSTATSLTSGVASNGTVWSATTSSGIATGCATGTPDDDVWYKITTASGGSLAASLTGIGSDLTSSGPRIQMFSGTDCNSLTSVACGTTSLSASVGAGTYYLRIYSAGNTPTMGASTGSSFTITTTIAGPPSNDNCAGAINLSSGVTNNSGSVWFATQTTGVAAGCATGDPDDDVWYRFTPAGNSLSIALSAIGTDLATSGARIQLFSGSCGSLTSVACGTTSIVSAVSMGNIYYIRIYSAGTGSLGAAASGSAFSITASSTAPTTVNSSRMKEVYHQTILSPANALADPWEITYGKDNYLWITEAKGYKVYRMDPATGVKTTVLDISQNSTFLPVADQGFNVQFSSTQNPWPQGGMAGLAMHPDFMAAVNPKNYVYISYVRSYNGGSSPTGLFFTNRVVRFTYDPATNKLGSPVSLCDTLPGSSDHNSQRIIIAPVGGTNFLFYASGDMGAGQFGNKDRPIRSQIIGSYEGKILRFNLESDGDAGLSAWIPNDNPYSSNSAVWCIGMRNNQGFAYDSVTNKLYGSSHGPFSDDEINILESGKNYGHPLVIGYSWDDNVNNTTAGAAPNMNPSHPSSCPVITDESNNAAAIGADYRDPLFSAYPSSTAFPSITNLWNTTSGGNSQWPSEGWSGMDVYKNTVIPGWKNSLVIGSLKWGRVLRFKLSDDGTDILPIAGYDTISYFGSTNRYRDVAFAPNGRDMFVIMDRSTTNSGPSSANPIVPACAGCVQKYTFLGYADAGGKSTIPTSIEVTPGVANTCATGTTVTIDNSNNNLWVPITGPDGNILAEIKANGNNLGTVTSSFYVKSGANRQHFGKRYLNRNITITPAVQPSSAVSIRLYMTKAEYDLMDADPASGVSAITDLRILKNNDACGSVIASNTQLINPTFAEVHGSNGYMLQASITSFSSFYFGTSAITLPVELVHFKGSLQNNATILQWETVNESNASHFVIERSIDNRSFETIGKVNATGNSATTLKYGYTDNNVSDLSVTTIYYRLKMVDADDQFKYSAIVTINLADITSNIILAPNPTTGETKLTINATANGQAVWKLVDNNGRVMKQSNIPIRKGTNTVSIDAANLPAGIYFLQLSGTGFEQNIRLQKL